jgi:hypothetical protein
MSVKQYQTFQEETFSILEEFCLTSGLNSECTLIAKNLEKYIIDELDYKLNSFLEYELAMFWQSPTLSISDYVLKRYQFLISADPDQTLGSLLRTLVIMKHLIKTLSNLPQFQVITKIYEKVCWMFVMPTYDTIINKDFYNRALLVVGDNKRVWGHYNSTPSDMSLITLQSARFNAENAKQENDQLIRFLTKKCAEITSETCEIQERLRHIAAELSPGHSVHFNSFSSINESSESLATNEFYDV